jgi:HAD superfamily hydrolase (TIGR01509 family)
MAFRLALKPYDMSIDYKLISGLSTREALLRLFKINSLKVPSEPSFKMLLELKQKAARELIPLMLKPIPGVREFIQTKSITHQLALVTSGSRTTVELALATLGLSRLFQHKIFSEDVLRTKPAPDGFLMSLKYAECHPSEALIFEDSSAGFQAAKSANIDFIDVRTEVWRRLLLDVK